MQSSPQARDGAAAISSPKERNQAFLEPFLEASVDEEPLAVLMLSPHALRIKARNKARKILLGSESKGLRDSLESEMRKPVRIKLKDKVAFTLGVMNTAITIFWLGRFPDTFWIWYCLTAIPLLGWRYISYSRQYYQYFLLDFCYMANALCFAHLFLLPRSSTLFLVTFASVSGPVASAILAWRNSLVFHSVEKMTSLFIHFMPAALVWAQRWHFTPHSQAATGSMVLPAYLVCPEKVGASIGHKAFVQEMAAAAASQCVSDSCPAGKLLVDRASGEGIGSLSAASSALCPRSYWSSLMWPLAFYAFWQVAYFLATEVWHRAKLDRDPRLQTSLRWLARSGKGFLHDLAHSLVVKMGLIKADQPFDPAWTLTKVVFMTMQLLYTLVTLLPTFFMFNSYWVHCFTLVLYATAATWNGSAYYIEVFAARYLREIEAAITRTAAAQATAITKAVETAMVQEAQRSVVANGGQASPAHFQTGQEPASSAAVSEGGAAPAAVPPTTTATGTAATDAGSVSAAASFKHLDLSMPVPVFRAQLVADVTGSIGGEDASVNGGEVPMRRTDSNGSLASMASEPGASASSDRGSGEPRAATERSGPSEDAGDSRRPSSTEAPSRLRSLSLFDSLVQDLSAMLEGPGIEETQEEAAAIAAVKAIAEARRAKRRQQQQQQQSQSPRQAAGGAGKGPDNGDAAASGVDSSRESKAVETAS